MNIINKIKEIKAVITDCDGVLTDGGMYYSENGDELKKFNTKDGMAFKILKNKGYFIGIVTGEKSNIVQNRGKKLKMDTVYLGVNNKIDILREICENNNFKMEEILYFGDDINDYEVLKEVGISVCPKDANKNVKKVANIITKNKGGQGVIREIVDKYFY